MLIRAIRPLLIINRYFKPFLFCKRKFMEPVEPKQVKVEAPKVEAPKVEAPEHKDVKHQEKPKKQKKPKEPKPEKAPKEEKKVEEKPVEIIYASWEKDVYGDYKMIQSSFQSGRVWTHVIDINEDLAGKVILVRARVHNTRSKGNNCFIVLREQFSTVQAVAFKNETITKDQIKYMAGVPSESIVDIEGLVEKPEKPIESCTQKVEIKILKFFVVNRATNQLPLQIEDASKKVVGKEYDYQAEEEEKEEQPPKEGEAKEIRVKLKTRLDNRVIDLRTTAKQAIFRLSSAVCQLFREFLDKNGFIEIHTPKLIGGTSEGGANVFRLKYFGKEACLAQSPQLYKQMCIMADFDRVYEIAPVFRAENSFTHRHMCEFIGLDVEMAIKEHYYELLDFLGDMFVHIFEGLETRFGKELKAINEQFEFEPFRCKKPALKLTYAEGIELLKENGIEWSVHEDLSTKVEKQLGDIVRKKYDTDFYMLHRYPKEARPFYTMPCPDDPNFTCSYDFFMRGEEITSGAQRIHDPIILEQRAKECGIDPNTIRDYISSFQYGAFPHGGCGVGLERVVMLYCGLGDVRNACMFPRDPKRITP